MITSFPALWKGIIS